MAKNLDKIHEFWRFPYAKSMSYIGEFDWIPTKAKNKTKSTGQMAIKSAS